MSKSIQELVENFKPQRRPCRLLEAHHHNLIQLRSKGASYDAMQKLLTEGGLLVSIDSIKRFCRKYGAEILREETKTMLEPASTQSTPGKTPLKKTIRPNVETVPSKSTTPAQETTPTPSIKPLQQDGPRIAYDTF
jgi:hypothetical protein